MARNRSPVPVILWDSHLGEGKKRRVAEAVAILSLEWIEKNVGSALVLSSKARDRMFRRAVTVTAGFPMSIYKRSNPDSLSYSPSKHDSELGNCKIRGSSCSEALKRDHLPFGRDVVHTDHQLYPVQ